MKIKIVPRLQYILVKPETVEEKNQYGLMAPASVEQEQKAQGKVIAVSPEIKDVEKGDLVVYGAFAGEEIKMNEGGEDQTYKLLHNDDVIAFIRP